MAAANPTNGQTATGQSVTIEDLYKNFGILADAKEDAGKHESVYIEIIAGTKSGTKEKLLAVQFITRFFKYFPNQMTQAIDAIFDLCENPDVALRRAAIKSLGTICKDCAPANVHRIADVLTQILQTNDLQEFEQVQTSLIAAFKHDPKTALNGTFTLINTVELEQVRKRAIKFLGAKLPAMFEEANKTGTASGSNLFNKELEDAIIKHVKDVLIDVDAEEFISFIKLLTSLPSMNTLTGRQDLVNIIMTHSEIDKPFEPTDQERLLIIMSCIQQAIPLFSKNVPSTKYVNHYIANVLPTFGKQTDENCKFEILKALADLSIHYSAGTCEHLINLYNVLIEYLPKPNESQAAEQTDKQGNNAENDNEAKFVFSYVECLLYSFHLVARHNQEFLSSEENKERLKDLRLRLQFFAKGTQNYIKELKNLLIKAGTLNKDDEETKVRRVALKITTNVDLLIKDFFHNPPNYKTIIVPSWKTSAESAVVKPPQQQQQHQTNNQQGKQAQKRSHSTSNNSEYDANGRKKPERGIYQPPSGKYSHNGSNQGGNNNNNGQNANGNGNGNNKKRRTFSHGARFNRF